MNSIMNINLINVYSSVIGRNLAYSAWTRLEAAASALNCVESPLRWSEANVVHRNTHEAKPIQLKR